MPVVCVSGGAPAVVAVSELVEEQAFAGRTVRRNCRHLAVGRGTLTITVDGGRRRGKPTEAFSTDMASEKTNGGERSENGVQDLCRGLSACS